MVKQFTVRYRRSPGQKTLSAWQVQNWENKDLIPQGILSSLGLSSLDVTSRPQLFFSSWCRKAAKPGGWHQDQLQWLMTPATDQSVDGDHDPERAHLENWWRLYWNPPLRPSLRFWPVRKRYKTQRFKIPIQLKVTLKLRRKQKC